MAINGGLCIGAKRDFILGVHSAGDQYRLALYTNMANIGPETAVYTPEGEVPDGNGYKRGGQPLRGFQCGVDSGVAVAGWKDTVVWPNSTIVAHGALIYNASKGNRAVVVVDFGREYRSDEGAFQLFMPPLTKETAVIRIF